MFVAVFEVLIVEMLIMAMLILITRLGRRPADPNSTLMLNSSESRGAGRSVRANFNFRLFYV